MIVRKNSKFVTIHYFEMEKLRCIIVDDIEIDRLMVSSYVNRYSAFEIVGVFADAISALTALENNTVDILFLDIDMPSSSGIELRKKALEIPVCVFITSHTEYAVESFELEAIDYIVKPVNSLRFSQTVKRIEEYMDIKNKASLFEATIGGGALFIKEGTSETKVNVTDILYLEALKNYTIIITTNKRHKVLLNIGMVLKDQNFESFIRVHRGFAVQKHYIEQIASQKIILKNNITIPVGRNYKENLSEIL